MVDLNVVRSSNTSYGLLFTILHVIQFCHNLVYSFESLNHKDNVIMRLHCTSVFLRKDCAGVLVTSEVPKEGQLCPDMTEYMIIEKLNYNPKKLTQNVEVYLYITSFMFALQYTAVHTAHL